MLRKKPFEQLEETSGRATDETCRQTIVHQHLPSPPLLLCSKASPRVRCSVLFLFILHIPAWCPALPLHSLRSTASTKLDHRLKLTSSNLTENQTRHDHHLCQKPSWSPSPHVHTLSVILDSSLFFKCHQSHNQSCLFPEQSYSQPPPNTLLLCLKHDPSCTKMFLCAPESM